MINGNALRGGPNASGGAASFVRGAVIGAFASLVVALVAILVHAQVRARRAGDPPPAGEDDDENDDEAP